MNRRAFSSLAALPIALLLLPSCGRGGSESHGDGVELRPAALDAAHEAYLVGDWLALGRNIRELLLTPKLDEVARDNALALLDKAYEQNNGELPADFTLPPGVRRMRYLHVRAEVEGNGAHHRVVIGGVADKGVRIAQLRVVRLPDQVLLDKKLALGTFESQEEDDGQYFEIESDELPALPEPGVYSFAIELENGEKRDGWFIADRLTSKAAPTIIEPPAKGTVQEPHPLIGWEDFRSPDYRPFERRTLAFFLMQRDPTGRLISPWSLWTDEIDKVGIVRIGEHPLGSTKAALVPGEYCVAVTFGEARGFGPLRIVRASRRVRSFHVDKLDAPPN